jgi:hypothetical protein
MPVKYLFFLLFTLLFINDCAAQDTVARRNRLSDSVVEHFFELKAKPGVKEGSYTAFLRRKILLAKGEYKNGQRVGVWQFFDVFGNLSERYDYDNKQFTFEAPLYANADLSYRFDDSLKKGDRLTRPLKIGGTYMGYVPYFNIFQVPFDTGDIETDSFVAVIELLVSPLGRLADYKVRLVSAYYQNDQIFSMDVGLFSDEDRTFRPATLNGRPVMSRILIKCYVSSRGELDFY